MYNIFPLKQSKNGRGTRSMDLTTQHGSAGKRRDRCLNDGKSIATNAHGRSVAYIIIMKKFIKMMKTKNEKS